MRLYGVETQGIALGEVAKNRKVIHIPFQGEFIRDAADYEIVINETPVIIRTGTPTEGWIALLPGNGTPPNTKYGTAYVLKDYAKDVELIEYGYGVDMGTEQIDNWWQYLVIIREPAIFLVRMAYDTDKKERYYVIFKGKKVHEVYPEELSLVKNALELYDLKDPDKVIKAYKCGDRETLVELNELKKVVSDKVVRVDANMVGVAEEVIGIPLEDPDKLIHTGEGITELSNLIKKEGK